MFRDSGKFIIITSGSLDSACGYVECLSDRTAIGVRVKRSLDYCLAGCLDGETEVKTNTNNHGNNKGDQTCNGGLQSYCCACSKPPSSKDKLIDGAKDVAKEAAKAAAEQTVLDLAAKAFCRVAVPALLAPPELAEDLIPFVGEALGIAEIAATPALIQACVKGVEKEGKAEIKAFGKTHTLSMDKPSGKRNASRPPQTTRAPPRTTSTDDSCGRKAIDINKRADCLKPVFIYTATDMVYQTTVKTCGGLRFPQACLHYSSAAAVSARFNLLTCSSFVPNRNFMQGGTASAKWSNQHDRAWTRWVRRPGSRCQRDEWPPQHFWQGDPGQLIRFNHLEDNTVAGGLWSGFCPEKASERCKPGSERVERPPGRKLATTRCRKELTLKVMSMSFDMDDLPIVQVRTAGLSQNECYPQMLINNPGFALLNEDPYFRNHPGPDLAWGNPPGPQLVAGRNPPFKRDLSNLGQAMAVFDNCTTSRKPTAEEMNALVEEVDLFEALRELSTLAQDSKDFGYGGDLCPKTDLLPDFAPPTSSSRATATPPSSVGTGSISMVRPAPSMTMPSIAAPTVSVGEQFLAEVSQRR
ncbi:MAG: hypothetical protein Q9160_003238 [Pyrenula sp. 1 TL-2023]